MKVKILHLTLHRKWFDEIRSGKKKEEYRDDTKYWVRRLQGRKYDEIRFVNGYGKDRPFMRVKCKRIVYHPDYDCWIIYLGKILEIGNV